MPPSRWCVLLIAANPKSEEKGFLLLWKYEEDHVGVKNLVLLLCLVSIAIMK